MPVPKRSRILPAKIRKAGNVRQNKHRFEGFHERAARLTINPAQKARQQDERATESYVKARLEFWKDTNLSKNFVDFMRDFEPLCDSLAQILHNEEQIFDLLIAYIQRRDEHSLEPLLDLLAQFAHDIGVRFEKYFATSLQTIVAIVSGHQTIEVVEWSFNALAWFFQYLSKLLSPDLRPTYDLLAPLLGKQIQKEHVARFTAEALSFLLRKAASKYNSNPTPLTSIIQHILHDWSVTELGDKTEDVYSYGLMTLFADSIKDVRATHVIRFHGAQVYETLLAESLRVGKIRIVVGVTTSLIHHTTPATFAEILAIALRQISGLSQSATTEMCLQACEILYTLSAVRRGDRISDWKGFVEAWDHLKNLLLPRARAGSLFSNLPTRLAATILQTAPFEMLTSRLDEMMELIACEEHMFSFAQFCFFAWKINSDRFHKLIKPFMFRQLADKWDQGDDSLLYSMQAILNADADLPRNLPPSLRPKLTKWTNNISENILQWSLDDSAILRYDIILDLADALGVESVASQARIAHYLQELVGNTLDGSPSTSCYQQRFILGTALSWYLKWLKLTSDERPGPDLTWRRLTSVRRGIMLVPSYVDNLTQFLESSKLPHNDSQQLPQTIIQNLATGSSRLRLASLNLLNKLHILESGSDSAALLSAIAVENTPPSHQSLRVLGMQIARLPVEYCTQIDHPWLGKAIVYYLFGAMTIKLAPLWKDVVSALQLIYEKNQGSGVQLLEDIAFLWLETCQRPADGEEEEDRDVVDTSPTNEFQCTNLRKWQGAFDQCSAEITNSDSLLRVRFDNKHLQVPAIPRESTQQALRVLGAMPMLAERRSRRLVPLFLKWASTDEDSEATLLGDASPDRESETHRSGLTRADQKSMLGIFGLFHNPNVLHQSSEVYEALLRLMANGDVDIQKAALKALNTWKQPGIRRCQEELNNLLDNARFREELVVFLPDQTAEKGLTGPQRRELMPVLLRLLYGRIIARGSAAAGRASQSSRRKAVFEALGDFPKEDLELFVDIILGPLRHLSLQEGIKLDGSAASVLFPLRKQLGLVRLIRDLLGALGDKVEHTADQLLTALLYCLNSVKTVKQDSGEGSDDEQTINNMSSLQKAIRQGALQALAKVYEAFKTFHRPEHVDVVVPVAISPRLGGNFSSENGQSVSSTFDLVAVWASSADFSHYLFHDPRLLVNLLSCLDIGPAPSTAKPEVKIFILEKILGPLINNVSEELDRHLLDLNFYETLLTQAASLLEPGGPRTLLAAAVSIILQVASKGHPEKTKAGHSKWSEFVAVHLVKVFGVLLELPAHVTNAATKTSALVVLAQFIPAVPVEKAAGMLPDLYQTLSKLFATAREVEMRQSLCTAFNATANLLGGQAAKVARVCTQLNSISMGRLDEPDYNERELAFKSIAAFDQLDDNGWMPLLYNALFFVKDQEELVIRKGASGIMKRFIDANASMETAGATKTKYPTSRLMRGVLLPALRRGTSERTELIRVEFLNVMAHLIRMCPEWSEIEDLAILATTSDESESFFDGILHIQQDWRKRSLIKLARVSRQGHLSSNSIAHYLLPLVQQFVFDRAEDDDAHSLSAQSIITIGSMISSIDWTQARKTLRHYSGIIKDSPELEKAVIRLIGVTTEAIHNAMADEDSKIRKTAPSAQDLSTDIENVLLPPLASFLRHKDENVVSLRVPIAVSAARLVCLLPTDILEFKLGPVLTDVCNILRSKAQESRDLSRKTLSEIVALIGPQRFSFVLKELRIALSRGYQLHVLSYTVHSLLVASGFQAGDLDYCLPQIMRIVLDDTFGSTGQEKDAEGYTNKSKEVKGSKSMDTAERLAKITSIDHLKEMIMPVHRLLVERLDSKATVKIDELLRRIRVGLEQNLSLGSQASLVFCFEVLQQAKVTANGAAKGGSHLTRQERQQKETFEVKTKGARKAPHLPRVSSQQYKLARFALDLLREILRRYEGLRNPGSIAGFLTPVGDVLFDAQEEVQISAFRFLASIVQVPLSEWHSSAVVYSDVAYKAIRNQPDTNTELSQAAIKLLTSIIKDRPEVLLKDSQMAWLIKAIIPDLTQPSAQGVSFNLLKAMIQRRIVINEIYEAMDALAKLFITYGDGSARNQARSIWLQFVITYEQSEKRFNNQLAFMTKNLEYKHAEGRQSVMEAINFLLIKLDHDHLQKAVLALFIPVMSRFIGDEIPSCRDMAGLLLKTIVSRADDNSLHTLRKALQTYLGREDKPALQVAALRVYASFVVSDPERANKDYPFLLSRLQAVLTSTSGENNTDWELQYYALQLLNRLCEASKLSTAFDPKPSSAKLQVLWNAVYDLAAYPHAWVKHAAAKLMRVFFSDLKSASAEVKQRLENSSGLSISSGQVCSLVRSYFRTMLRRDVQQWLVDAIGENLQTLNRRAGDLIMTSQNDVDGAESDDADSGDDEVIDGDKQDEVEHLRQYSIQRISAIIRRDSTLTAKHAALTLLSKIVHDVQADDLLPVLSSILTPLNHLTDFNIPRMVQPDAASRALQEQLVEKSQDIMTTLQRKLPEGEYVNKMHMVQQEAKQKREERRGKRRIEAVANPQAYAKDRIKKRMKGRDRRKDRNQIERSKRRGY